MPTDKPRVTITMNKDLLDRIEAYRFDTRQKNQTQAILSLLQHGLNYIEGTPKENAPSVSDEAMRLAKDYDRLDTWGQKQVRAVADNELARLSASHILRIAGRDGRYEEISIDDEQLEELKEYIRSAPDASDDL